MKRVAFGVLIGLLGGTTPGTSQPVSVCDLIRHRVDFIGRIVAVRGEVRPGGHGPYLIASRDCDMRLETRGVAWPNVVYLAYPNRSGVEIFQAPFEVDWPSVKRARGEERRQAFNPSSDQLFETITGLFVSYRTLDDRVTEPSRAYPGGLRVGFGPVGLDAPAQILIKSITDVRVVHEPRK